ncbi:MAG: glycosyltransferase family 4 protein [Chloroflexi bacterium]|nr:glycosyltransferase family 4 protein [Chloroflexota bacterium]
MKIALVSPYDWAVPGGVNRHVFNLSQQFLRRGHDVTVVAPASKRSGEEPPYLHVIGHSSIGLPVSGSVANISMSYNLSSRVKKLLAREQFDIVHIHEPFAPLLPFQFVRFSQATNIATFHAARDSGSRVYAYTQFIIQQWWHRIHGRIAHSQAALDLIGKYFDGDFRIIPSGIDYARFAAETPPIPDLMDAKRNIVFVGRQEQRKGLPYLIEAFARLKAEMPETRLIIVGPDGGIRPACERYIEEHNVEDVVFTDYVAEEDLPRYYRSGDVFCAPNTGHESLGLILLEAMASGVPIVASRIPGFAAVVKDGEQGLLVPPRDSEALCEALKRLLSDAGMREAMGRAAALHARSWSWDEVSSEVLAFYEETAANRNGNGT